MHLLKALLIPVNLYFDEKQWVPLTDIDPPLYFLIKMSPGEAYLTGNVTAATL